MFVSSSCRNPLKFTVEDATSVQLYPETDEPVNILNIKRGIVSALVAPVMEEGQSSFMVSALTPPTEASPGEMKGKTEGVHVKSNRA